MWCKSCRVTGYTHCAHPDECGNMVTLTAAADSWKSWLDDAPLPETFNSATGGLQDFITALSRALLDARAELAATQTQVGDWIVRADEANVKVEKLEAELAAAQQREAALTKALEACVASLERVDTAEGVCCCGDSMDRHSDPMSCGHSPVDMGDYYAGQALESARAALAQTPTDPGDGWTWNERLGWIGPDGKPADPRRRG